MPEESFSYGKMTFRFASGARPATALLAVLLSLGPVFLIAPGASAATPGKKPLEPGRIGTPLDAVGARSPRGAVASDTAEASRVAAAVLEAGGNAVDAAVAGAFALGASAPGSSGLGGQTWMVVHTAAGEDVAFLSHMRAPRRLNVERARAAKRDAVMTGPLASTAPGSVATLARAHARFGTRPWAELVAPAVAIAEAGTLVTEIERLFLLLYSDRIEASPALRPLYMTEACDAEGGAIPVPVGHRVVFPDLARTLRRLAEAGPDDFYSGRIAAEIVADLGRHDAFLRADDLARVPAGVVETPPLRGRYRDLEVLSLPAPGGGGVVLETLQILQAFPPELLSGAEWERAQLLVEAVRIALADERGVPVEGEVADGPDQSRRLGAALARERAGLIRLGRALEEAHLPQGALPVAFSDRDTTHLAVVDREGNAVSLTQSLGRTWGSTHVTPGLGFPHNAFLEGFSLGEETSPGYLRPNASLRTSVAPTILLRDGKPLLVLGAAGSTRIPSAIANVVVGVVDRRLGVAEAVAAPRVSWSAGRNNRGMRLELAPPGTPEDAAILQFIGYGELETFAPGPETSNFGALNAVGWNASEGAWEAGAEPRRQGAAAAPGTAPREERAP